MCLFGFNYWLVYLAEQTLTSGLVSVFFSLIVFLNIVFNSILLKAPFNLTVFIGGIMGIGGTVLIFKNELSVFNSSDDNFFAIIFCLTSIILASLGNIISAYNQKYLKLPVIQTNALGMIYGGVSMLIIATITGVTFNFDMNLPYISSLVYLALFGSIVAFTFYLKLLGNIGPDRSAYVVLIIPIIAMLISTLFEGYVWQKSAIGGIILLLTGNFIAMTKNLRFNFRKRVLKLIEEYFT